LGRFEAVTEAAVAAVEFDDEEEEIGRRDDSVEVADCVDFDLAAILSIPPYRDCFFAFFAPFIARGPVGMGGEGSSECRRSSEGRRSKEERALGRGLA
jgi:hypothetical protein